MTDDLTDEVLTTEAPTRAEAIHWPEKYQPASAEIFAHNEITIDAPAETVWAWLIRAESWPDWYKNSHHIHFISTSGPNLRDRSRIRWQTFGFRITSKVLEFVPCQRIAWESHGIGVAGYHGWVLTRLPNGATHVMTEKTQRGWLVRLRAKFTPKHAERMHQLWLEGLKARSEAGPPA